MPDATGPSDELKQILDAIERLTKEKEKAELEQHIAEAQKAVAVAQQAAFAALLPVAATKPLEGTIEAENVVIEAQIQTYKALRLVATNICAKLPDGAVVVYYDKDVNVLAHYAAVKSLVLYVKERYVTILGQALTHGGPQTGAAQPAAPTMAIPGLLVPMAADAVLRSVLDVVALFRTDVNLKGEKVDIPEEALIAALASERPSQITYPLLMPGTFLDVTQSDILKEFNAVVHHRGVAEQQEIAYNAKSDDEKKTDPFRAKLPFLKALNEQTGKLIESFVAVTGTDGLNGLARLLRAEILLGALASKHLLFVKVLASGGNSRTERKLWSTKFRANGGCVVAYILISPGGAITKAGVEDALTKFE